MGKGAGRLERAILGAFPHHEKGISTGGICRAVYPDATLIEKRHRVAVLQAIHRIMNNPPRPMEDRTWTIGQGARRGYWKRAWVNDTDPFQPLAPLEDQKLTACHEAGHALGSLYFGSQLDQVVVYTRWQSIRQDLASERAQKRGTPAPDPMDGFVQHPAYEAYDRSHIGIRRSLITSMAGPIAEAHFKGKWPLRERGLSQTYDQFFAEGGRRDQAMIDTILVDLSDDPGERAVIRRRAQALAQALIRSDPGWRFIKLLAEKMLTLKHGSLKHHGVAAIFRQAFGRPPPDSNAWNNHWPPTLQRVRVGWLPPLGDTPA